MWGEKKELRDRGLRILATQTTPSPSIEMQLTAREEKVVDFDNRCQQVAMYLWNGKSVCITQQQLAWYDVSPHQMISELLGWVQAEEAEHVWEAVQDGAYFGDGMRQFTVYCTKRASVYMFKAKVIV
jgi:hypothetical protein